MCSLRGSRFKLRLIWLLYVQRVRDSQELMYSYIFVCVTTAAVHLIFKWLGIYKSFFTWRIVHFQKQPFHLTKHMAAGHVLSSADVYVLFPPTSSHTLDTHPHHVVDNGNTAQVEIMYLCWPSSQWKENNYSFYLHSPAWLYLFIWCKHSEIIINDQSS